MHQCTYAMKHVKERTGKTSCSYTAVPHYVKEKKKEAPPSQTKKSNGRKGMAAFKHSDLIKRTVINDSAATTANPPIRKAAQVVI